MKRSLNVWLLIIAAVCGLSLWLGKGAPLPWHHDRASARGARAADKEVESMPGLQVLVLNGTRHPGLAREFGLLLGRCGLAPVGLGNASPQNYGHSFLVNRRLSDDKVSVLRSFLGELPVLQEFDGRATEDAVLVLGADQARLRAVIAAKSP